jgi:hypothetical protein
MENSHGSIIPKPLLAEVGANNGLPIGKREYLGFGRE